MSAELRKGVHISTDVEAIRPAEAVKRGWMAREGSVYCPTLSMVNYYGSRRKTGKFWDNGYRNSVASVGEESRWNVLSGNAGIS
jgi:hypothetical protein